MKMTSLGPVAIEVNDNPNIDAGNEDSVLGDDMYRIVLRDLMRRLTSPMVFLWASPRHALAACYALPSGKRPRVHEASPDSLKNLIQAKSHILPRPTGANATRNPKPIFIVNLICAMNEGCRQWASHYNGLVV
jgi:hypothetical protein